MSLAYRYLLFFIIFFCAIKFTNPYKIGNFDAKNFYIPNNMHIEQTKAGVCDNLIIFDLTKNIVTEDIFDISIKIFLKFILEYCNGFKYVSIGNGCGNTTGCKNITINSSDTSNGCESIIDNLDYDVILSSYSDDLYIENSNPYVQFLNQTFSEISPCKNNSVLLLTNRIVNLHSDSSLLTSIKKSESKLMVILLGRNESNATETLAKVYENIPNSKTLSLLNYDCLNYLFYCILPCSSETPECIATDISDCQYPSKITPNDNPRATLHAWYVFDYTLPLDRDTLLTILRRLHDGLQQFAQVQNISNIRVKAVRGPNEITESLEDFETTLHLDIEVWDVPGSVINDTGFANELLGLIPWSGTLIETRIGVLAIIIITNYATPILITENNGQHLSGQMFMYDRVAYDYYVINMLKNDTNFHLYFQDDIKDDFVFYPIQTASSSSTQNPPSPTSTTSTTSAIPPFSASTAQYGQSNHSSKNTFIIVLIICGTIGGIILLFILGFCIYRKRKQFFKARQEQFNSERRNSSTNIFDQWKLTWDKLEIRNEIGSGAYGQILQGKLRNVDQTMDDGKDVAIKMPSKLATDAEKKQFLKEIDLMKTISGHDSIIKMIGCIMTGNRICIVLEFCEHFDLLKYVKKLKINMVLENEADIKTEFLKFFWQISHGIQFFAEKGIVHRDLAARNILIDSNKNAKITDFGLSIQLQDKTYVIPSRSREKLPIKWLAIESFKDYKFSLKTDVWTFGIVLYEMYSFGETPYEDVEASKLLKYLENGNRLKKPDFCVNEIFEIMLKCWKENPFRRPTITVVIENFTQVLERFIERHQFMKVPECNNDENKEEL